MKKLFLPWLLMCCCLGAGLGAAELKDIPDPTRPAPGFRAKGASHGDKQASASEDAASAAAPAKPMLMGIRMDSMGGQALAMIGDDLVSVGDRVGSATVVAITRSEVTLRDERGLHKMQMDEGVSKSPATDPARKQEAHPEDARKPALKKSRRKETS